MHCRPVATSYSIIIDTMATTAPAAAPSWEALEQFLPYVSAGLSVIFSGISTIATLISKVSRLSHTSWPPSSFSLNCRRNIRSQAVPNYQEPAGHVLSHLHLLRGRMHHKGDYRADGAYHLENCGVFGARSATGAATARRGSANPVVEERQG